MSPLLIVLLFVAAIPAVRPLQSSPPASAPAPAASVAGTWTLVADLESPDASSTLDIKLDGTKVTGTIVATGTWPVAGEYVDGKLSFAIRYNAETTVRFVGQLRDDGTLAGTLEYGEGPVTWRAKRKE